MLGARAVAGGLTQVGAEPGPAAATAIRVELADATLASARIAARLASSGTAVEGAQATVFLAISAGLAADLVALTIAAALLHTATLETGLPARGTV